MCWGREKEEIFSPQLYQTNVKNVFLGNSSESLPKIKITTYNSSIRGIRLSEKIAPSSSEIVFFPNQHIAKSFEDFGKN